MFSPRPSYILTLALVAFLLLLLQLARAQSDTYEVEPKRQSASKYCGKQLSNTLQLVCHGLYNSMFKKSGQGLSRQIYRYKREMEMDDYQLYGDSHPFRSRSSAKAMMGRFGDIRFRRESRGVHDECCIKPCSMSELLSYCAKPR